MAQASDYPITFGYGATDDTYYGPKAQGKPTYIGPYHKGDDRAMPSGTPVVVNGVQIGLSGSGNGRYGAHLHTGKFVNGADVNPNGGGFQVDGAKVITVVDSYSTDPVNAKYVRIQDSSGAQWVYLHLSQINVKVGQSLQGEDMLTFDEKHDIYREIMLVDPNPDQARAFKDQNDHEFLQMLKNNGGKDWQQKAAALRVNNIRADFLKKIGASVGLDPDKDGLEAILTKVQALKPGDFKPYDGPPLFTKQ